MKLIGTIHKFNTRRMYGENGQEIVWGVVEQDDQHRVVNFIDRARGIRGTIDLHFGNLDLLTNEWVLRAYDDFHYRGFHNTMTFFGEQVLEAKV
jgi:hypothetical protein